MKQSFFFFFQAFLSKCDCHLHMTAETEKLETSSIPVRPCRQQCV